MANKRISELTSITGANLADADLLVVVDVSDTTMASSGTNKKVTLNEFAQDSTFSSRYKPLASDTLFVPAGAMAAVDGSPSIGTLGNASLPFYRVGAFLFDTTTSETVSASVQMPVSWATFDIYLWWSNAGAGSGAVKWYVTWGAFADTETTDTQIDGAASTTTAPAQYVVKRQKINSGAVSASAGEFIRVCVLRDTNDAGDTLGNDAGVIAVELVRVS